MQLAIWSQSFDRRPTIGESAAIPFDVIEPLDGYDPQAVVSRIEQQENLPVRIDLAATCRMKSEERPVIVLNSNRIPDTRRATAEAHLRKTLRFPIITWEASNLPDPVVRFRSPASGGKSLQPSIRSGLLDLIHDTACV